MTKDEALRLALEFIPSISPAFICEASHHKKHEQHASNEPCPHVAKQKQVYEAIKAALETKEESWEKFCDSHCVWTDHHPDCKLAQIEQPKVRTGNCLRVGVCASEGHKIQPQRTWVGLTDEEIEQGCKESWVTEQAFQSAVWWAEAKLKEKNK